MHHSANTIASFAFSAQGGRGLDLSILTDRPGLTDVTLDGCRDTRTPPRELPPSLRHLAVKDADPDDIEHLVAVLSSRPSGLESIELAVAPAFGTAAVDLGFLRLHPLLSRVVLRGVQHVGSRPSPLAPPFSGIPNGLRTGVLELDATNPRDLRRRLRAHLGRRSLVTVHEATWRTEGHMIRRRVCREGHHPLA